MTNITVLAIDIAKTHFQLHGVNHSGKTMLKKALTRTKLLDYVCQLKGQFTIAMEACGGANYWARTFKKRGYEVALISPQYVKGFLVGNKNDANDAQAIAMAAQHDKIPRVPLKSVEQQDYQTLYKVRESVVSHRTATSNMIRGFLLEYGEVIPRGLAQLRRRVPELLEDGDNQLTPVVRQLIHELYLQVLMLDKQVAGYDQQIKAIVAKHPICQRLMRLKGVGPVIALLSYASVCHAEYFKNGRHCAAYLGLVPKEHSTGGKHRLLGISKRGNSALRGALIHGARAVVKMIGDKQDKLSRWLRRMKEEKGYNKCCVALANKLARHIWAIMAKGDEYQACSSMMKS